MSTNDRRPTEADLRAALLDALATAGHPATIGDGRIIFAADGASTPVAIDADSTGYRTIPASLTLDRFGDHRRRFAPRSGAFDWPLIASEARRIATALSAVKEREAERSRLAAVARSRTAALNATLGLGPGAALRAGAAGPRLVLSLRDTEASEAQIRAMVAAARACGLLPPAAAPTPSKGDTRA